MLSMFLESMMISMMEFLMNKTIVYRIVIGRRLGLTNINCGLTHVQIVINNGLICVLMFTGFGQI